MIILGEKYRHFKGGEYQVIAIGKDSETLGEVVVYSSLKDGSVWVRSLVMFEETVYVDDGVVQRFTRI
jgi:hypothetical protein